MQAKSFRPLASQSPRHDSQDNPKRLHRALGGPKSHDVTSSGRSLDAGVVRIPNGDATHSRTRPRPPKTPTGILGRQRGWGRGVGPREGRERTPGKVIFCGWWPKVVQDWLKNYKKLDIIPHFSSPRVPKSVTRLNHLHFAPGGPQTY